MADYQGQTRTPFMVALEKAEAAKQEAAKQAEKPKKAKSKEA